MYLNKQLEYNNIWKACDFKKKEKLHISEFLAIFVSSLLEVSDDDIMMAYKYFNQNAKDETMTSSSLKKWTKTTSIRYSKEDLLNSLKEIQRADRNELSYEDFRSVIRGTLHQTIG